MEPAEIAELKRFAKQLEEDGGSEETRAAARAILLLADEVESLTLALAAQRGADADSTGAAVQGDDAADGDAVTWFRRTFSTGASGENGSE